jgi:dipeptidyl aminopeptidase/acylaminoacyl peptidase
MLKKNIILLTFLSLFLHLFGQYKLPSQDIVDIYETKKSPYMICKPQTKLFFERFVDSDIALEELADPTVKLAGKKFSKRLNATKEFYPTTKFNIFDFEKKHNIKIDLSKYKGIRTIYNSHDYSKAIMTNDFEDGVGLVLVDLKTGKTKDFPNIRLNGAMSDPYISWFANNKKVLIRTIVADRGPEPTLSNIPKGPIVEETHGKVSQLRTYTKLLQSPEDEILFDYYFTSQIAVLDVRSGKLKNIGKPGIYKTTSLSPNNKYILVKKVNKPYSYQVPYYYFPSTTEVWNLKGKVVKNVIDYPLQDEIPIGGTYSLPRYHHWYYDKPATLMWYEAQDQGNPKNEVEYRDIVYTSDYPFKEKEEIYRTEHRASGLHFFDNKKYIIHGEYDRDKVWYKEWLLNVKTGEKKLITDMSANDSYADRGEFYTVWNKNKDDVILTNGDLIYYKNNSGATPEGNRPYIASYNIKTGEFIKLYQSELNSYEQIVRFANKELTELVIAVQTKEKPRNYFIVDLVTGKRTAVSNYQDPYPDYAHLKKELVHYKRSDGVDLSGILYLPHDYKQGDKLPVVIHAYPQEYTSKDDAGQVSGSDKTFTWYYGSSIKYFAMSGYAVLANASIPIVGDPETVNDTFIEQLLDGVQSAVDYLDTRGVIDTSKVGIIGHSYGAFMVANVLANSDICQAGIAKSGAYNRTLTPFGFQSERRTFWQAKDFYINVSPFSKADQINEPILLIHGEEDPNSGTYPMQSKRLFKAIKGNGGNSKLVILPLEEHGYKAKESQLHVLSEMIEWFDKFLK